MTTAPLQVLKQMKERRVTNRKRGLDTAWKNDNEYISLKKGYPIMIAGVGGAGKTEFTFDLILNASLMHGWKWLILSPETGDKYEIIEVLIEKLSQGRDLAHNSDNPIPEDELDNLYSLLKDKGIQKATVGFPDNFDLSIANKISETYFHPTLLINCDKSSSEAMFTRWKC